MTPALARRVVVMVQLPPPPRGVAWAATMRSASRLALVLALGAAAACQSGSGGGSGAAASAARLDGLAYVAQTHSLSCEAAALEMAMTHQGIRRTQEAILAAVGVDRTPVELAVDGSVLHWGDPYERFVGDVDGSETDLTGYGVYAPALARAAAGFGARVVQAGEGIEPATLYAQLALQHPVIAWVSMSGHGDYSPRPTTTYTAFNGRPVVFGPGFEHAVVLVGASADAVHVYDPEPDVGPHWMPKADFEAAYQTFGRMAVVLG
jgi:uncharacterized protein YvpB